MPDPFERHSRPNGCCEGIYSQPPRSQLRAAAVAEPERKRPAGKKDPALCKAAHWKGLHRPVLRRQQPLAGRDLPCTWQAAWTSDEPSWSCWHDEVCAGCGKVLRVRIGQEECPDFCPITAAELAAIEAELQRHRQIRAARRPVIDGPQGYRRKRAS